MMVPEQIIQVQAKLLSRVRLKRQSVLTPLQRTAIAPNVGGIAVFPGKNGRQNRWFEMIQTLSLAKCVDDVNKKSVN